MGTRASRRRYGRRTGSTSRAPANSSASSGRRSNSMTSSFTEAYRTDPGRRTEQIQVTNRSDRGRRFAKCAKGDAAAVSGAGSAGVSAPPAHRARAESRILRLKRDRAPQSASRNRTPAPPPVKQAVSDRVRSVWKPSLRRRPAPCAVAHPHPPGAFGEASTAVSGGPRGERPSVLRTKRP
jgi:hypothetical protein